MREIKFRAWDSEYMDHIDNLYWFEESGVTSVVDGRGIGGYRDYHIMQFTGLLDSEGNEIYEGDYVTDDDCILGIVHYVTNSNSIYAGQYILTDGFGFAIDDPELEDCDRWGRVCGNIHQNPELLDNDK